MILIVNTRKLGRKYELLCKKKLQNSNWLVSVTDMPQRFKKQQDFFSIPEVFGGFDLIAIKDGVIRLVQVKLNCASRKKILTDMLWFKQEYVKDNKTIELQLWDYRNKYKKMKDRGWRIDTV